MSENKVFLTKEEILAQYEKEVKESQRYGDQIRAQVRRDNALAKLSKQG